MKFNFNPLNSQFELQANNCGATTSGSETFASTPSIQNVSVENANEEIVITLPTGTRKFLIKVQGYTSSLKLSYAEGESGNRYINITRGCSYTEDGILTTVTKTKIYIQSTKPNVVVECLTWV